MDQNDPQIPRPVGDTELSSVPLGTKMERMCIRLNALHTQNRHKGLPSDMVRGAVFVARSALRKNPDWFAQAAHSLRDTLYPFLSPKVGGGQKKTIEALKNYGSVKDPETTVPRMGRLFGELSDIAHHGIVPGRSFEDILAEFETVLADALGRQSDIHGEIDELLSLDPSV
jgi:hypothetical protein